MLIACQQEEEEGSGGNHILKQMDDTHYVQLLQVELFDFVHHHVPELSSPSSPCVITVLKNSIFSF